MGLANFGTRALLGMDAPPVSVEVHSSNGLPALTIVGLPETSVKESKDRVRSALLSSGFQLPPKRITVNLAPADLPKTGGRYDLAIALAILVATEQVQVETIENYEVYAELALNGDLRPVNGVLSSLIATINAGKKAIVSSENVAEVSLLLQTKPEMADSILLAQNLKQAYQLLSSDFTNTHIGSAAELIKEDKSFTYAQDFSDVIGQAQAKRALEISASGYHSMLMVGPPGSGKSMLASRLVTILPPLGGNEAIELAQIRSLTGKAANVDSFYQRPFIHPHHTASAAAIVGGGTNPKPGALSLAHRGVLFLDELPEFNRNVLEALREPLETKQVNISRVNQHVNFPANNLLIAAMNPSPSGYFADDPLGRCKDTPDQILRYQKKISGPLIDRIDLHIEVPAVEVKDLRRHDLGHEEQSEIIRNRVVLSHGRQFERQGCLNSELTNDLLKQVCSLDAMGEQLIDKAVQDLGLSVRGYHRVLKVARTIADIEASRDIKASHIAEALGYRVVSKAFN